MLLRTALLVCGLASGSSSCLVTSKQQFTEPGGTPPFLSANDAAPPLGRILVIGDPRGHSPVDFSTSIQSEDQNTPLEIHLVADDVAAEAPTFLAIKEAPPGHLSTPRAISATWDPKKPLVNRKGLLPRGCHPITLIVSHKFNYGSNIPVAQDDQDFLVWWVIVGDPADPAFAENLKVTGCATDRQ